MLNYKIMENFTTFFLSGSKALAICIECTYRNV